MYKIIIAELQEIVKETKQIDVDVSEKIEKISEEIKESYTPRVKRQRRSRGVTRARRRQYYRKNRQKIKRKQKLYRKKHKNPLKRRRRFRHYKRVGEIVNFIFSKAFIS